MLTRCNKRRDYGDSNGRVPGSLAPSKGDFIVHMAKNGGENREKVRLLKEWLDLVESGTSGFVVTL